MKAILISDRPEWVAKIINGEKTIEIRKTMPKCKLPIDVYVYCTKRQGMAYLHSGDDMGFAGHSYYVRSYDATYHDIKEGKILAKFTLRRVEEITHEIIGDEFSPCMDVFKTKTLEDHAIECLSLLVTGQLKEYMGEGKAYAWHISDLVIFDEPKELSEFRYKKVTMKWDENYHHRIVKKEIMPVKRPPQSWQYVEV